MRLLRYVGSLIHMGNRGGTASRVTLVSTRTIDRVPRPDGTVRQMPGGPAHYVGDALHRLKCPFSLITAELALVDVLFGPHGEDYLIPALPRIELPSMFETEAVILSPIMQEIDASSVPHSKGILAIDLQGFVRVADTSFHDVNTVFALEDLMKKATLVKASREEIDRLDVASRRALHGTLLVVTQGARGVTLRRRGREVHIDAIPVDVTDTIGAGDTFLAALVVQLLDGMDEIRAATDAMRFVESVLRERAQRPSFIMDRDAAP